ILLPAPERGPDRALRKTWPAAAPLLPPRSGAAALLRPALLARPGEESPARRRNRALREPAARRAGCARVLLRLGRDARLRVPDLPRLQRLHRHGARAGAHVRDRAAVELRPALPRRRSTGVLAALARHPVDVAARLPVHPARRQPQGRAPARREPARAAGARRPVARR